MNKTIYILNLHRRVNPHETRTDHELINDFNLDKLDDVAQRTMISNLHKLLPDREPATPAQLEYCIKLFKKVKIYYRCITDHTEFVNTIRTETGFDLSDLSKEEANSIIRKLQPEVRRQRQSL